MAGSQKRYEWLLCDMGTSDQSSDRSDAGFASTGRYSDQQRAYRRIVPGRTVCGNGALLRAFRRRCVRSCDQRISSGWYDEVQIAKVSEEGAEATLEELLNNYAPITEKIVTEQVAIPYETITKNTTGTTENTTNRIIQQGKDGIKEITYKIKYQNDVEIEKIQLSETVIKEPVNKIVQVNKTVTSRSSLSRTTPSTTVQTGATGEIYKITAYCSCAKCCGKTNGITAAGTKATAGRTIAASSKFALGTKLNINGHTYTVEDRGGAIKGNKIDIYVNSHAEALAWGVRYLPVTSVQ